MQETKIPDKDVEVVAGKKSGKKSSAKRTQTEARSKP